MKDFTSEPKKPAPIVKKNDIVNVRFKLYDGSPEAVVDAYTDSEYNKYLKTDAFQFLLCGDMMMNAKWNGNEWICD